MYTPRAYPYRVDIARCRRLVEMHRRLEPYMWLRFEQIWESLDESIKDAWWKSVCAEFGA